MIITERQLQALKLCHHDFEGLTMTEAAMRMGISTVAVCKLLARVKEKIPQYFPLMTKLEVKCYHHLTVDGWPIHEIANKYETNIWSIYRALQRCRDKGLPFPGTTGKVFSYNPDEMDGVVKEKF